MSSEEQIRKSQDLAERNLPAGEELRKHVARRKQIAKIWHGVLVASTIIGMIVLATLMVRIADDAFGLVVFEGSVQPEELTGGREFTELSNEELLTILEDELPASQIRIMQDENDKPIEEFTQQELITGVEERVVDLRIVESYSLVNSLFNGGSIRAEVAEDYPNGELQWYAWLNADFLDTTMSQNPVETGVGRAIMGTLWIISLTMLFAFPLGVGAAIYLEEYATATKSPFLRRISSIIQTNINNLAGVPSIIYGMLGLAIFVRAMEPLTSGINFGVVEDPTTANGRTIISGAMTLALLILPLIIINSQEAIRAVPSSLRQASYGLGATKWQTIWNHVLPVAIPGILTGTILSMSRAIGETAPLIVIGAATFITTDPDGPFSKFTVMPMQIYTWTAQPQAEFRNIAAAAIIILLAILLTLNAIAAFLRIHFRKNV